MGATFLTYTVHVRDGLKIVTLKTITAIPLRQIQCLKFLNLERHRLDRHQTDGHGMARRLSRDNGQRRMDGMDGPMF